jgi:hypothetical protein
MLAEMAPEQIYFIFAGNVDCAAANLANLGPAGLM